MSGDILGGSLMSANFGDACEFPPHHSDRTLYRYQKVLEA